VPRTVPASAPAGLRVSQRLFHPAEISAPRDTCQRPATVAWHRPTHVVVAAIIAVASTIILLAAPAEARPGGARLDASERKVVKLVNRYRARHGRPRLRVSRRLNRVADRHSREMARHNFFAHASRNGTSASTRVRRSTRAAAVGENLAFLSSRRGAARRVVGMWINSPGHRAVLLNRSFRRIGVGRRTGRLGGSRGSHFTADFASRR
jgi:uncharacterized protein YkwD